MLSGGSVTYTGEAAALPDHLHSLGMLAIFTLWRVRVRVRVRVCWQLTLC